jgi:hypothetical protein
MTGALVGRKRDARVLASRSAMFINVAGFARECLRTWSHMNGTPMKYGEV